MRRGRARRGRHGHAGRGRRRRADPSAREQVLRPPHRRDHRPVRLPVGALHLHRRSFWRYTRAPARCPMYEVYALKYAERDTTKCQFFYREASHDPLTLHYFVWLILGGPHPVLVDTGFLEDDAEKRGIRNYVRPSTVVERVAGVKANNIPIALISHLHYDHWAGHSLFPNAEYWVQKDEVAFWTGPWASRPAFRGSANVEQLTKLVPLNYGTKLKIIDGDREVL